MDWKKAAMVGAAAAALGCGTQDYAPRVICHNANCVEPADVSDDDTPEALEASMALEDEAGVPLIDGVEVDTFWYGAEDRCLFAHDLDSTDSLYDVGQATDIINRVLGERAASGGRVTRTAPEFTVLIELKGHVGPAKSEKHSPEQRTSHVECATGMGRVLGEAAVAAGYPLEIVYTSFDPALLADMSASQGYADVGALDGVSARVGVLAGVPAPLDSQTKGIDAFDEATGIDFVSAHPHWTRHAAIRAYESRGWTLGLWMFSIVPETLDAIEQYEPEYVTTSEARALTRWLER